MTATYKARLAGHRGYTAIQAIPGVGPVLAAVFVAEIGGVDRFTDPAQLASWTGLTPRHRKSDTTVHRGRITKQGATLVRWAASRPRTAFPAAPAGSPRPKPASANGAAATSR